ncbi:hypothetical protein [Pleomorphovibrio marinus]|uniref:hypothetical protein n=1 Tax=Pleomorphovibrio marinus TaxID=2164132 RepID=UPI000E0A8509|nr:hypothetical protein [Pleomorphovibrio marinus]
MLKSPTLFPFFLLLLLGLAYCNPAERKGNGLEYELIKLDSFQVSHTGELHGITFHDNEGILYNFRKGSFIRFNVEGEILHEKEIPVEGANSISYVGGLKMTSDGLTYLQSLKGEIGILDEELNLIKKIQMPFAPSLSDLRSNVKSMDVAEDKVYVYFPGRDGTNPYEKGFFKKNHLLERVDMNTGESLPFLRLAEMSKYQEDLYFEHPFVFLSIHDDKLHFAFDNEPIIFVYLLEDGAFLEAIPLEASTFIELEGQFLPLDQNKLKIAGMIDGLYAFENGFAVNYIEGISENTFLENQGNDPSLYTNLQNHILKVYNDEKGWSNEIILPKDISYLLDFNSPEEEFYALKNEGRLEENRSTLTFYKMKLSKLK